MIDSQQLSRLSQVEIDALEKKDLVDIRDVHIDRNLPAPMRMLKYLDEIENPYCFLCGDVPVKLRFSSDGDELNTLLKSHFITLKR